jgi:hypothetical protein
VIWLTAIEKCPAAFDGGCTEFVDLPRSGGPHDIGKIDDVRVLMEAEEYLSQKKMAQMPSTHHETVKQVLRYDLNMREVNCKWTSRALDSSQKPVRSNFPENSLIS